MLTAVFVGSAVVVSTVLASAFMWWATKRSAVWAMAGGSVLAFVALAGALVIAYFMTRAAFAP